MLLITTQEREDRLRRIQLAAAVVVLAAVLGATVFSEQVAWAAQGVSATIIGPLDQAGNVKVAESGSTELVAAGRVTSSSSLGSLDVRAYKEVRIAIGAAACGSDTMLWVIAKEPSAAGGSSSFGLDFFEACGADSRTYEVPARTLEIQCVCPRDHFLEVAVWGRRN